MALSLVLKLLGHHCRKDSVEGAKPMDYLEQAKRKEVTDPKASPFMVSARSQTPKLFAKSPVTDQIRRSVTVLRWQIHDLSLLGEALHFIKKQIHVSLKDGLLS